MIEFVPDILQISFPCAVGLVAFFLYRETGRFGLALISAAFFLSAVPSTVRLAMGGPYWTFWLRDQGYTPYLIGTFNLFMNITFQIIFAILVIAGLVKLSTEA